MNALPTINNQRFWLCAGLLAVAAAQFLAYTPSEPFFYNDETRHILTGVYFRDLLRDRPYNDLVGYTVRYYLQYPALGLLIWPPFFYVLEGAAMTVFGTSMEVGRVLTGLFGLLACGYVFRFVNLAHGRERALAAMLFFGLSPIIFRYSHYIMLEMPTLALALAATFHFWRYLEADRRRDLFLAGVLSALSALTRFDAVYLLPLFGFMLAIKGRWDILRRREVWLAALVALLLVTPSYALTAKYVGWLHVKQASEQLLPNQPPMLSWRRLAIYFSLLPGRYLGWPLLLAALAGLAVSLRRDERRLAAPFLALLAAVYLTFTAINEVDERHAIYWLPAWAFLAAQALWKLAEWWRKPFVYWVLALLAIGLTLPLSLPRARAYVRGYEEVAQYVLANTQDSPFCFFVGRLNGNLGYQLRRHDEARRLWLLRADKLLFNDLISPTVAHQQVAANEQEMLDKIYRYDPAFLVVEIPGENNPFQDGNALRADAESRIRALIASHPEHFRLEKELDLQSNYASYRGIKLKIYRNLRRNPQPERNLQFENLNLRDTLHTTVP